MTSTLKYRRGRLCLGEVDLVRIAQKHQTPVYVYSTVILLNNLEKLRRAFKSRIFVHYSMKANSNISILKKLRREGAHVDVVSAGEIKRALEAGFSGADIIFSGVGKSSDEMKYALSKNIFIFNVESPEELERLGQIAKRQNKTARVSFRLNPDVDARTHPYITTGFRENKFGMDKSFLPRLKGILKKYKSLKLVGLDFHIGSQLTSVVPYVDALKKTIPLYTALQNQGYDLKYFDIGGGLGIRYHREKVIEAERFGREVEKLLKPLGCQIICEPGRFLIGNAGVLLTEIEYVKKTPSRTFVIVNTGMHHLLRPSLYEAHHQIFPLKRKLGKAQKVEVVGPICESADFLGRKRHLISPQSGDILAIADTGAYGFVMASEYNLHSKPKEIVI